MHGETLKFVTFDFSMILKGFMSAALKDTNNRF